MTLSWGASDTHVAMVTTAVVAQVLVNVTSTGSKPQFKALTSNDPFHEKLHIYQPSQTDEQARKLGVIDAPVGCDARCWFRVVRLRVWCRDVNVWRRVQKCILW